MSARQTQLLAVFEMMGGVARLEAWLKTATEDEVDAIFDGLRKAAAAKSKGDDK